MDTIKVAQVHGFGTPKTGQLLSRAQVGNRMGSSIMAQSVAGLQPPLSTFFSGSLQGVRAQLYLILEEPESSRLAKYVSLFIMTTIVGSIVVFAFETMPQLKNIPPMTWLILEIFFTSVFSLEYLMRFFTATAFGGSLGNFFTRIMNVCDFLALLPFFIELATRSSNGHTVRILRAIRMFRLFRVLKLGRYSIGMRIMAETIRRSSSALWVLAFFVCIAVVLFSSVVWYMERFNCPAWEQFNIAQQMEYEGLCTYTSDGYAIDMGLCCTEDNTPSNFPSIIHAFWWAIVTLSTVGYGDVVPWTVAGRIFGICTMFSGILVIALPVAIIGSKFQEVYQEVEVAQMEKNRMVIFQKKQHGEEEIEREAMASLSPSWGPSVDASPDHEMVDDEDDWVVAASSLRGRTANDNNRSLSRLTSLNRLGRARQIQSDQWNTDQRQNTSGLRSFTLDEMNSPHFGNVCEMSGRLNSILEVDKLEPFQRREVHKLCTMMDRAEFMRANVASMHEEESALHDEMRTDFVKLINILSGQLDDQASSKEI